MRQSKRYNILIIFDDKILTPNFCSDNFCCFEGIPGYQMRYQFDALKFHNEEKLSELGFIWNQNIYVLLHPFSL